MLSLERLRMLHAIAEHGSVGGAAASLHVTTAAVSQQMSKLEREVGQRLLLRNGRGVRLTDAGQLLAGHTGKILSGLATAEADLAAHLGEPVGELVIAAFATAARGLLPQTLMKLRQEHPNLRTGLRESDPELSFDELRRGDIDMAVVLDWVNKPLTVSKELSRVWLVDDVVDMAVPAGHRLAGADMVSLEQFADDDWIVWSDGEMCSQWLMNTLAAKGVQPRVTHTAEEHQTQLALVAAGLGVAILPRLGRDPVPDGVAIVPVAESVRRRIHVVWRTDADRRPAIQAALEALRQVAGEHGQVCSRTTEPAH